MIDAPSDRDALRLAQLLTAGYTVIPEVLTPQQITRLREICWDHHKKTGKHYMKATDFLSFEELAAVPFSHPVVTALKGLLGQNYTNYPDFHVQTNKFGGWHTDCSSEGRASYLYAPDYLFVKCGVFLQDNVPERGGGIDIIPRGYRLRLGEPQGLLSRLLRYGYHKLAPGMMLKTRAGDMAVFDSRVFHQSTRPRRFLSEKYTGATRLLDIPRQESKHVLYWDASRTDEHVAQFVAHGLGRAKTDPDHSDFWSIRYPASYPAPILQAIQAHGINTASA